MTGTSKMIQRTAAALLSVLVLTACVSVLPEAGDPSARYTLEDIDFNGGDFGGGSAGPVVWSLAVDDPSSTRAYDTTRIALTREKSRIEYYASGEWVDRAPLLFSTALIRSFENSGRILGVGSRMALPLTDFILQTDIRALRADYAGDQISARVEVFARLTDSRGRILASKLFTATNDVRQDSVVAVAGALETSSSRTLHEIMEWVFSEADRLHAK